MKSANQNDTMLDGMLFREVLFLPLCLSWPEDKQSLAALFGVLPEPSTTGRQVYKASPGSTTTRLLARSSTTP